MSDDVVIVFALQREADPFLRRKLPVNSAIGGVGAAGAFSATHLLIEAFRPRLVVAAGFCGALAPHLQVGDIVRSPRVLTVDHLVGDPVEKKQLYERHAADAVDMESAAVETVCADKGVPFLAVRAVSDTSDTRLSPQLVGLLSGGNVSAWKALKAGLRRPALFAEYRRLARDTKLAADKLADALVELVAGAPATSSSPRPSSP